MMTRLRLALSYSLICATIAATVPATAATAQPVFRVRSTTAPATPAPKGETLSPDVHEENTWRQIGPGLFRTRETLTVARTNAGSRSGRVWYVSHILQSPTHWGLVNVSYAADVSEEFFMWVVENGFKNQTDLNASAYLKNGYLYIHARSTLWVRGPALPHYDFRRVIAD